MSTEEKTQERVFLEGKRSGGDATADSPSPVRSAAPPESPSAAQPPASPPSVPPFEENVPSPVSSSPAGSPDPKLLSQRIIDEALKKCFDPEIPVNIYELGLVYSVDASPEGVVNVKMTLTAPACPVAGTLPGEVEAKVKAVPGVKDAKVELVWDPPWTADMMSRVAKVMLGM